MLKRLIISLIILLALPMIGGAFLLWSNQLPNVIQPFLPKPWQLSTAQGFSYQQGKLVLPQLSLKHQACELIQLTQLELSYAQKTTLQAKNLEIDYACLMSIPSSESQNSLNLTPLLSKLAMLPHWQISVENLKWNHLPEEIQPRLRTLLATPSRITLTYQHNQTLQLDLQQQAGEIHAEFTNPHLTGKIRYQPTEHEVHQLHFNSEIDLAHIAQLPENLQAQYQWQLPKEIMPQQAIQQGSSVFYWQKDNQQQIIGNLDLVSDKFPQNRFNLPFKFDGKQLAIQQGEFYWDQCCTIPLQGYITAQFTPNNLLQYYPIQTSLSVNLLTQSASQGGGNLELTAVNGVIDRHHFNLPLRLDGTLKYQDLTLQAALPIQFEGSYTEPQLKVKSQANIKINGNLPPLKNSQLQLALEGIQVDQYGINGKLIADFQGDVPNYPHLKLHFSGLAEDFTAGMPHLFSKTASSKKKDNWQWQFSGETELAQLKNKLQFQGQGHWQHPYLHLNQFSGTLSQIKQSSLTLQDSQFELIKPIRFNYNTQQLTGKIALKTPELNFSYGGKLSQLALQLQSSGTLAQLALEGELKTQELPPIRFNLKRQKYAKGSLFNGHLQWQKHSAKMLQTLSPFSRDWIITDGSLEGDSHFSFDSQRGFIANGALTIEHGQISMPKGEITGINFHFPFQFKQGGLDFGLTKPIHLKIKEWDLGVKMQNIQAQVSGHYPHTNKQPLHLKQLSMDLLGGQLTVENFELPQTQAAHLHLTNIDSRQILDAVQYSQLKLNNRINAELPFYANGHPCYVCNGKLYQAQTGNLKFTPELVKAISKSSGYTERLLMYLLNDTEIQKLNSHINIDKYGDMLLTANLKLKLAQQSQAKINFNYQHKENVFMLWDMINTSPYAEQNIENLLYKQLDKR